MTNLINDRQIKLPIKSERHKLFGSVEPTEKIKPTKKEDMADLQNTKKDFLFKINSVGISNVKYPVIVESQLQPTTQNTIGTFTLASSIDQTTKGTNMSRFLEQIEASSPQGFKVDFKSLTQFSKDLGIRLEQDEVSLEVAYPWFFEKKGPSSNIGGLNHGIVKLKLATNEAGQTEYKASLSVFVTTLCPCSKEISEYSAHSQRGKVTMDITFVDDFIHSTTDWKRELLHAAESNASAIIYPVLKRPDEKFVTESAYENPRFVEDMVRLIAADLYELDFVKKFKVICENEESIHLHNAIATIEYEKDLM